MNIHLKKILLTLLVFNIAFKTYSQTNLNFPYSKYMLGEIQNNVGISSLNIGGLSNAVQSHRFINLVNPAACSDLKMTIIDIGLGGGKTKISSATQKYENVVANLRYLSFMFPVASKWVSGLTLLPYSSVNYNIRDKSQIQNDSLSKIFLYKGKGSISKFMFINAFRPHKNLSLGVNVSFMFGSILHESQSYLMDSTQAIYGFISSINKFTQIKDFHYNYGFIYTFHLREDRFINIGFVFDHKQKMKSWRDVTFDQRYANDVVAYRDTSTQTEIGNIVLPASLGIGYSFEIKDKFLIGVDLNSKKWSDYRYFNSVDSSHDNYTIKFGLQYTPEYNSIVSFWKRITYSAGLHYGTTPLVINKHELKEFGTNFGVILPLQRMFTSMNLGFEWIERGTTQHKLLKEEIYYIYLGLTFNEKWFIKPKIE